MKPYAALAPWTLHEHQHLTNYPSKLFILLLAVSAVGLKADPDTDRKIEYAANASYNFRAVFQNQVKAAVENGIVTLTGTVLDREQKALAEDTVRNLPGVIDVNSELNVASPGPERADGWIALKIRSVLLVRSNVSATNTDVSVHNGAVVLSGVADSVAQRELTENYARAVDGVRSVKNEIKIRGQEYSEQAVDNRPNGEKIDDSSITAQVKAALLTYDSTSALKTSVTAKNGDVVIRGNASSKTEKELVTKLVRSVRGVASVSNEMVISAAE